LRRDERTRNLGRDPGPCAQIGIPCGSDDNTVRDSFEEQLARISRLIHHELQWIGGDRNVAA